MSAHFTTVSRLTISQHQLSLSSQACQLSDSVSLLSHAQFLLTQIFLLFSFFLTQIFLLIFLLFFCSADLTLMFEILIRFTAANDYFVLYHVLLRDFLFVLFLIMFCFLVWDFSQAHCYKLLFNLVQHFQKRFFVCTFKFQKCKFF